MKDLYFEFIKRIKPKKEENEEILRIKNALCELKRARTNFDMVVGADNVELAILELNAAEKRYQNLIKEAKQNTCKNLYPEDLNCNIKEALE